MKYDRSCFSNKLKGYKDGSGFSYPKLEERSGISAYTIRNWLNDRAPLTPPKQYDLICLFAALDLSEPDTRDLLDLTEYPFPANKELHQIIHNQANSFVKGVLEKWVQERLKSVPLPPSPPPLDFKEIRNRKILLKRVKNDWIENALNKSLQDISLIELDLEECSEAVVNQWHNSRSQPSNEVNHSIPTGIKNIADIFNLETGQALLVLGEAGSGKTTLLLEFIRDMLAQAEQNLSLPLPVVFNLSSWTDSKQPITEWLVDELKVKYKVPKTVGMPWIEEDQLLLLLDGLDEVVEERRGNCVEAINYFRNEHGFAPIVVCSRITDYHVLHSKLEADIAVCIRPLTEKK